MLPCSGHDLHQPHGARRRQRGRIATPIFGMRYRNSQRHGHSRTTRFVCDDTIPLLRQRQFRKPTTIRCQRPDCSGLTLSEHSSTKTTNQENNENDHEPKRIWSIFICHRCSLQSSNNLDAVPAGGRSSTSVPTSMASSTTPYVA